MLEEVIHVVKTFFYFQNVWQNYLTEINYRLHLKISIFNK